MPWITGQTFQLVNRAADCQSSIIIDVCCYRHLIREGCHSRQNICHISYATRYLRRCGTEPEYLLDRRTPENFSEIWSDDLPSMIPMLPTKRVN